MTRIHEPSYPSNYPVWPANDPEGPKLVQLATMMPSRRDHDDTMRKVRSVAGAVCHGYMSVEEVARRLSVTAAMVTEAVEGYRGLYPLAPHAGEGDGSTSEQPSAPSGECGIKPNVQTEKIDRYRNRAHAKHGGASEVNNGTV